MEEKSKRYHQIKPSVDDRLKIRERVEVYLRHWKWIVFSGIVFLITGFIYNLTQPEIYEFKASVLIVDPNSQMSEVAILRDLSDVGLTQRGRNTVNNEELIFNSTTLLLKVVSELKLYTLYDVKENLHYKEIYNETPYEVSLDSVSLLNLQETIKLEISRHENQYEIVFGQGGKSEKLYFDHFPVRIKSDKLNCTIRETGNAKYSDSKIYVTIVKPKALASTFAYNSLTTTVNRYSDDIQFSIRSKNVQKGFDVLDVLIKTYNKDANQQLTQTASSSSVFINERLKILNIELSEVESSIEDFKQINKLTNIDLDASEFLKKNANYFDQLNQNEIQLQLSSYINQYVSQESNRYKLIPDIGIIDNGLVLIINDYNRLVMQREQMLDQSTEQNPALEKVNSQLSKSRVSIISGINNTQKALQISRLELDNQNLLLKSKLNEIPRLERELIEVQRQQRVKESLFMFLLQKKEEAALNMAVTNNKAKILNFPDVVKKVSPNTIVNLIISLAIGFILPLFLIFFKRMINTKIQDKKDVEILTNIPVLTELGHNVSTDIILDYKGVDAENTEHIRLLKAKLRIVMNHPSEKVILITSTLASEGKTFVSVNLAISLSLKSKKVLLIGFDLRKPKLTKAFNLSEMDGLSNYLAGNSDNHQEYIYQIDDFPNLFLFPSGAVPPNPNELLQDEKVETLFEALKKEYDYIVVDSAPIGLVSDTYLIDRVSDVCLYICRAGFSDRRSFSFINELYQNDTFKKMYLLVNDVKNAENKYSYNRYGYGYRQKPEA